MKSSNLTCLKPESNHGSVEVVQGVRTLGHLASTQSVSTAVTGSRKSTRSIRYALTYDLNRHRTLHCITELCTRNDRPQNIRELVNSKKAPPLSKQSMSYVKVKGKQSKTFILSKHRGMHSCLIIRNYREFGCAWGFVVFDRALSQRNLSMLICTTRALWFWRASRRCSCRDPGSLVATATNSASLSICWLRKGTCCQCLHTYWEWGPSIREEGPIQ